MFYVCLTIFAAAIVAVDQWTKALAAAQLTDVVDVLIPGWLELRYLLNDGMALSMFRGGPGLGGIQPSQSDYFLATRGPGHGDFHVLVLAPASVQEMADLTGKAFDLAEKYRMPAVALESLSNAIDAAGGKPTRAQVVEAMANVEITSITGTFQFDEKGDNINAKAYAYEIVDGYPGKLVGELTGA